MTHLRSCHRRRGTAQTRPVGWCRPRWPAGPLRTVGDSLWLCLKPEQSRNQHLKLLLTFGPCQGCSANKSQFMDSGAKVMNECVDQVVFVSSPDDCCASSLLAAVSSSLRRCDFSLLCETCWTRMKDEMFRGIQGHLGAFRGS